MWDRICNLPEVVKNCIGENIVFTRNSEILCRIKVTRKSEILYRIEYSIF